MTRTNLRHATALALLCCTTAAVAGAPFSAPLVISEFRVRGPNGANDEFIEITNVGAADHTVASLTGSGYGIAASDGVTRATIPNGTVIPRGGSWLAVNSVGYSLASHPAGNGTTATGDATYTTDIPDNAGIALFNNNDGGGAYATGNRIDAVGSTSEANAVYKEGAGYPALTPFSIDYAFYRDVCGKSGSISTFGECALDGATKDTGNNAADFIFVDTNGTSAGAGQRLGAPGPENLSAPTAAPGTIGGDFLDGCVGSNSPPNRVRDFTSDPANNSTFGTMDFRYTFTNNTGGNLTRLRFRVVDLTTFPAPSGIADFRPRTATAVVVTVDRAPCGSGTSNVTVQGTTLEQPPSQPNGGGFNSTLSAGTVTLATPLANGASIDVRFLMGIQQTGSYRLGIVPEGLPDGGFDDGVLLFEGCTDAVCAGPNVTSIVRAGAVNPVAAGQVTYTVTFSESVTGVDPGDFALTTTGAVAGASIVGVAGTGSTRTVTVDTGTGSGTVRLDVIDDDTIRQQAGSQFPLGGYGVANGNFVAGQTYAVDATRPSVDFSKQAAQADPTSSSPIRFTAAFSEPVTGFDAGDVVLSGTAAPATAVVSGGPSVYQIDVSGMTANGTVIGGLAANAAIDSVGNGSFASTTTDDSVTYTGIDDVAPTVTINQGAGQADPSANSPIVFDVVFSEAVTGFAANDVQLAGTAGAANAVVSGSGTTYAVSVSGMTANGSVIAAVAAGAAEDAASNASLASTSADATVQFTGIDDVGPSVTINQGAAQADPTGTSPITFEVVFSEAVSGFAANDVVLGGGAGATTAVISGGPSAYTVAVSGMSANGSVTASIPAAAASDAAQNGSLASTSTDATVAFNGIDDAAPTYAIGLAPGQGTPALVSPVRFSVVFSEPVTGFAASDVILGGSALPTTAVVSGGPTAYEVAVSGMSANGSVTIAIAANAVIDGAGNGSGGASGGATTGTLVFGGVAPGAAPLAVPATGLAAKLALLLATLVLAGCALRRRAAR